MTGVFLRVVFWRGWGTVWRNEKRKPLLTGIFITSFTFCITPFFTDANACAAGWTQFLLKYDTFSVIANVFLVHWFIAESGETQSFPSCVVSLSLIQIFGFIGLEGIEILCKHEWFGLVKSSFVFKCLKPCMQLVHGHWCQKTLISYRRFSR